MKGTKDTARSRSKKNNKSIQEAWRDELERESQHDNPHREQQQQLDISKILPNRTSTDNDEDKERCEEVKKTIFPTTQDTLDCQCHHDDDDIDTAFFDMKCAFVDTDGKGTVEIDFENRRPQTIQYCIPFCNGANNCQELCITETIQQDTNDEQEDRDCLANLNGQDCPICRIKQDYCGCQTQATKGYKLKCDNLDSIFPTATTIHHTKLCHYKALTIAKSAFDDASLPKCQGDYVSVDWNGVLAILIVFPIVIALYYYMAATTSQARARRRQQVRYNIEYTHHNHLPRPVRQQQEEDGVEMVTNSELAELTASE